MLKYFMGSMSEHDDHEAVTWETVEKDTKPGGAAWGHFNPDLLDTSAKTGCSFYFTPQKYWPRGLARSYFGKKTVFGVLRDPVERLVAIFRGNIKGYGGDFSKYYDACDVDGAVKSMMMDLKESGDQFRNGCTFVPQAEYFDGEFGITVPVDNRRFPHSANEILKDHGHGHMRIENEDVMHVSGCNEIWAGNLSSETKAMVYEHFKRDYELLCTHFGYCVKEVNT